MKKITQYCCIFLVWITFGLSSAFADFTLIDSDGDVYYVGQFLGKVLDNESYYVRYASQSSFSTEGEGILYYDAFYRSLKLLVFENDDIFGFSIEGHWDGDGSTVYFMNSDGQAGDLGLYFGDVLPRKVFNKTAVKNILKK